MAKRHWWSRRAVEAAPADHRTVDGGPSPLEGITYRPEDHDLLQLTRTPTDRAVADAVEAFASEDAAGRQAMTARLSAVDQQCLWTFAHRSSLRALRARDPEVAATGARALAMIDPVRNDPRDLHWAGRLVAYALDELDGGRGAVFEDAATLAAGTTATALRELGGRDRVDLLDWGYRTVETEGGLGLIADGGEDYEPSADLVGVGQAISAALASDPWRLEFPEVGTSVAPVWLRNRPAHEVDQALADVVACLSLTGRIDPSVADAGAQHLLVWVFETSTTGGAEVLAAAAGPGATGDFVAVASVLGRVGAIVIARSFVRGTAGFESAGSILRFGPLFDRALASAG